MNLRCRFALMAGSLLLVAGVSFLATRSLLPGAAGAGGPEGPDKVKHIRDTIATSVASGTPPPTPPPLNPTQQAQVDQMRATVTAGQRPPFVGELNGFVFSAAVEEGLTPIVRQLCGDEKITSVRDGAAAGAGELAFELRYWPPALGKPDAQAVGCLKEGRFVPVHFQQLYIGSDFTSVSVTRVPGTPVLRPIAPRDRISVATIGGRPALITGDPLKAGTTLFLRDETSYWVVVCGRLDPDECKRIAEGAR